MTTTINNIGLAKLSIGVHLGFHTEVQHFLDQCGVENIACTSDRPLYDAAILTEAGIVKRIRASALTLDLDQLDKERDRLISFLFATLKAAKHSPLEAVREASRHLLPVMKPFQGMAYHTHLSETAEIVCIVHDLRAKHLEPYVKALQFTDALNLMEIKNNEYMNLVSQRITEMPNKLETGTIRKAVDTIYKRMIAKAIATIVLMPNDAAEEFAKNINNFIHQINASYHMHIAHIKKKKSDLTTTHLST